MMENVSRNVPLDRIDNLPPLRRKEDDESRPQDQDNDLEREIAGYQVTKDSKEIEADHLEREISNNQVTEGSSDSDTNIDSLETRISGISSEIRQDASDIDEMLREHITGRSRDLQRFPSGVINDDDVLLDTEGNHIAVDDLVNDFSEDNDSSDAIRAEERVDRVADQAKDNISQTSSDDDDLLQMSGDENEGGSVQENHLLPFLTGDNDQQQSHIENEENPIKLNLLENKYDTLKKNLSKIQQIQQEPHLQVHFHSHTSLNEIPSKKGRRSLRREETPGEDNQMVCSANQSPQKGENDNAPFATKYVQHLNQNTKFTHHHDKVKNTVILDPLVYEEVEKLKNGKLASFPKNLQKCYTDKSVLRYHSKDSNKPKKHPSFAGNQLAEWMRLSQISMGETPKPILGLDNLQSKKRASQDYFRVFTEMKKVEVIENKFESKDYDEQKRKTELLPHRFFKNVPLYTASPHVMFANPMFYKGPWYDSDFSSSVNSISSYEKNQNPYENLYEKNQTLSMTQHKFKKHQQKIISKTIPRKPKEKEFTLNKIILQSQQLLSANTKRNGILPPKYSESESNEKEIFDKPVKEVLVGGGIETLDIGQKQTEVVHQPIENKDLTGEGKGLTGEEKVEVTQEQVELQKPITMLEIPPESTEDPALVADMKLKEHTEGEVFGQGEIIPEPVSAEPVIVQGEVLVQQDLVESETGLKSGFETGLVAGLKTELQSDLGTELEARLKSDQDARLKSELEARLKSELETRLESELELELEKAKEGPVNEIQKLQESIPINETDSVLPEQTRDSISSISNQSSQTSSTFDLSSNVPDLSSNVPEQTPVKSLEDVEAEDQFESITSPSETEKASLIERLRETDRIKAEEKAKQIEDMIGERKRRMSMAIEEKRLSNARRASVLPENSHSPVASKKKEDQVPAFLTNLLQESNLIDAEMREKFAFLINPIFGDKDKLLLKEVSDKLEQVMPRINGVDPDQSVYIRKVFELVGDGAFLTSNEFCIIASLGERLTTLQTKLKMSFLDTDFRKLGANIEEYVKLYITNLYDGPDTNSRSMTYEDFSLLLLSTGVKEEQIGAVAKLLNIKSTEDIKFVDFLSFVPFFVKLHDTIIANPFATHNFDENGGILSLGNGTPAAKNTIEIN